MKPIIFNTEMVKAVLDGRKTQTRRIVTSHNSIVGVGTVDWSKFNWNSETEFDFGDSRYSTESEYVPDELKGQLMGVQKAPPVFVDDSFGLHYLHVPYRWSENATIYRIYPRYEVGDKLWVRETHYRYGYWTLDGFTKTGRPHWVFQSPSGKLKYIENPPDIVLKGKDNKLGWYKRPSIFMPRWASRITLEITEVRVERLCEITNEDAIAEGCTLGAGMTAGGNMGLASQRYMFGQLWDSLNAKRGYGWEVNPWVWVDSFRRIG